MPLNGTQLTTSVGEQKLAAAALGTGSRVEITHVALGDGSGALYEPFPGQTGLKNELARRPISRQYMSGKSTWRVTVEFGTDIPAFWMREIGFFDAEGDLIFVVAGTELTEGYTSAFDLLFEGYVDLSGIKDGLVVVQAPIDAYLDHAAIKLIGDANHVSRHIAMKQKIRRLELRA